MSELVRIYVGADRSQLLAVRVLEHSIKRHTQLPVEVDAMVDLPIRIPEDPSNWQRTGFSFSRFCIPQLADYQGRALYLDADMLVFEDIDGLWNIPFDGAKVIIQEEIADAQQATTRKEGAPKKRVKQCAVMLLDCDRLTWKVDDIIASFDRKEYNYEQLMFDLCLLEESEIRYAVPFRWNSLEYYQPGETALIHYTDMTTQPWVSVRNPYGDLWLDEVRLMLAAQTLTYDDIQKEIDLGYFRPSLIADLRWGHRVPSVVKPLFQRLLSLLDKTYQPHQEVRRLNQIRKKAIKAKEGAIA